MVHRLGMILVCAFLAIAAGSLHAAVLEIQLTGVDLVYNGNTLYDAGSINGGTGNPAEADALISASFLVNGAVVGTLTNDLSLDVRVNGLQNIPVGGGLVQSSGGGPIGGSFGVDLLTSNSAPAWGLDLNFDSFQMYYSGAGIAMAMSGVAASVGVQSLPFGFAFDTSQPISVVLSSANITNITNNGQFLTGFTSSGTGNIAGTPEPASLMLLGLGGLFIARGRKA